MAPANPRHTYEVHLDEAVASALGIDSPVETGHIDYYDAGFWVDLPQGRDFYPYRHVLTIRERPWGAGPSVDADESRREPISGPAEPMD